MPASLWHIGTQYTANSLAIKRGTVDDITYVGVYHTTNPAEVPALEDFTEVQLVKPGDPLAEGNLIDVLALIGPRGGDVTLPPGDYQRWVLIKTATEDIPARPDVLTIL